MTRAPSKRLVALRAFGLVAAIVAAPAACMLDRAGLQPSGAGGSTSASTSSSSTSGTGGSVTCDPGSIMPCYEGPPATQNKGVCQPGQHTCNAQGSGFDACINQVLPAAKDDCAAGTDTDCSGTFECGCIPGTMAICYDGPASTQDVGPCKSGKHTCKDDATGYGACEGQTLPAPENCVTAAIDEDCDSKKIACTGETSAGASVGEAPSDEIFFAVAADPSGNVLLGGVSGATPPAGAYFAMNSGVGIISRVGMNGAPSWTVTMANAGGMAYSAVRGIASDSKGNVFIVGEFRGSTTGNNVNMNNAGGVDAFLAKLDPAGTTLWAKAFGNASSQFALGVAVDAKGNVVIAGRMEGAVDFGGGTRTGGGSDDLFVAEFDNGGKHIWSRALGDFTSQTGFGVATTPEGDVVVAGEFSGTLDFIGGFSLNSAGGADAFVAKLAGADGATKWANRYGDSSDQTANAVAVGSNGSVVITGSMVGKCNFGAGDLDAPSSHSDVFVAKLHEDGSPDWSHDYGDNNDNQAGLGVAVDPAQNIVVVGYFNGSAKFGATVLTDTDGNVTQGTDMFVAKLAADGDSVWARQLGDAADQTAWAVATDAKSNVIVAGTYAGTVILSPTITLTSKGGYDAFWAELAP